MHDRATALATPPSAVELRGIPASGGVSSGPVRILRDSQDRRRIRPGEILVCTVFDRDMLALLGNARGVIAESGGVLTNPATVAREYGIPMVYVRGASSLLSDGQHVMVDGVRGLIRVTAG